MHVAIGADQSHLRLTIHVVFFSFFTSFSTLLSSRKLRKRSLSSASGVEKLNELIIIDLAIRIRVHDVGEYDHLLRKWKNMASKCLEHLIKWLKVAIDQLLEAQNPLAPHLIAQVAGVL